MHRQALTVLRPSLATLWVDAVPLDGGWPVDVGDQEVREHVAALIARGASVDSLLVARQSSTRDTVVLDARRDDDFALAWAVAPFSAAVEGMSCGGQLLMTRGRVSELLRLRLTKAERRELLEALNDDGRWLIQIGPPNAEVEARSRGWRLAAWLIALLIAGPLFLGSGLTDLVTHRTFGEALHAGLSIAAGVALLGEGMHVVGHALRRRYRESRVPRR